MHNLRYKVFYLKLNWNEGLDLINEMEFDCYDDENANYIIKVNDNNEVIASCRLISTINKYMLNEKFSHVTKDFLMPSDVNYWEISRVCIAKNYRRNLVLQELMASIMEFGISRRILFFISYTTNGLIIKIRDSGWDVTEIPSVNYKNQLLDATVLMYPVNSETRSKILEKGNIKSIELIKEADTFEKIKIIIN